MGGVVVGKFLVVLVMGCLVSVASVSVADDLVPGTMYVDGKKFTELNFMNFKRKAKKESLALGIIQETYCGYSSRLKRQVCLGEIVGPDSTTEHFILITSIKQGGSDQSFAADKVEIANDKYVLEGSMVLRTDRSSPWGNQRMRLKLELNLAH